MNAGTCLEDANLENNVFTNIGNAVKTVISTVLLVSRWLICNTYHPGLAFYGQSKRLCKPPIHGEDETWRV